MIPERRDRDVPLMLERVQGAPLLAWLTAALAQGGARRFFLVAQPAVWPGEGLFSPGPGSHRLRRAEPRQTFSMYSSPPRKGRRSKLQSLQARRCIFPSLLPVCAAPAPKSRRRFLPAVQGLMEALDQDFSFSRFLVEQGNPCTQDDGFYAVSDFVELLAWQKAMNQNQLFRLAQQGVRIWDLDHCYVSPWSAVGNGTELLPGVILAGRNSVGSGCTIGPDTYLSDCSVADGAGW